VCEPELSAALRAGVIAGGALDALSSEPPAPGHPLLSAVPNLIVTPHLAWTSLAARRRLIAVTAENVAGILARTPVNAVNL
jgi:glycerate dehydrogenase